MSLVRPILYPFVVVTPQHLRKRFRGKSYTFLSYKLECGSDITIVKSANWCFANDLPYQCDIRLEFVTMLFRSKSRR